MGFEVTADAYRRFMGVFSEPLAKAFVEYAEIKVGQRVLDVGCGPGALTAELVGIVGSSGVVGIDPSASFVAAVGERFPDVDIRTGTAEKLPFEDDTFDAALAQLVVHFMSDPVAGLREMGRVTKPGGMVAATVWNHASGRGPLSPFWAGVNDVDKNAGGEGTLAGVKEGDLAALFTSAGFTDVDAGTLTVRAGFASFDEWWEPYTLGVGPAGDYIAKLTPERREEVRTACFYRLPPAPFEIEAVSWSVRARTAP
jgi:SAM-dependent methyltransferase